MTPITEPKKRLIEHCVLIAMAGLLCTWAFTGSEIALHVFAGWVAMVDFCTFIAAVAILRGTVPAVRRAPVEDHVAWIVVWIASIVLLVNKQHYVIAGLVILCIMLQVLTYIRLSK